MSEPRYYVVGISGYSALGTQRRPSTSYSVLDRYSAHREVARYYAGAPGETDARRKRLADERAAELNSLDAA